MSEAPSTNSGDAERYLFEPEMVRRLREPFASTEATESLVLVPSNPGVPIAAAIALRPRRIVVILTAATDDADEPTVLPRVAESLAALFSMVARPGLFAVVPQITELEGGAALRADQILPALARLNLGAARGQAFLVTGGHSLHTNLLTQHAVVTGARIFWARTAGPAQSARVEAILPLQTPDTVLVQRALRRSRELLADRAFDAARAALDELPPDLRGPVVLAHDRWIACCRARDAMNFVGAVALAKEIVQGVRKLPPSETGRHSVLAELVNVAKEQEALCQTLGADPQEGEPHRALVAELVVRAEHERRAGRPSHAALLLYRVAELCASERLRTAFGIDSERGVQGGPTPSRPVGAPDLDEAALDRALEQAGRLVGVRTLARGRPLGLVDQLTTLLALDDPAVRFAGGDVKPAAQLLGAMREAAEARNHSIFAHGYRSVDGAAIERMREILGLRNEKWGLIKPGRSFNERGEKQSEAWGLLALVAPDPAAWAALGRVIQRHAGPVLEVEPG